MDLVQAQQIVQKALDDGKMIDCPCCAQTVKKYPRSIYKAMLTALALMVRRPDGVVHKELLDLGLHSGDYAKLAYWALAERDPETTIWTATPLGLSFYEGRTSVPKYVYVYNGEVLGCSDEQVTIEDCRKKFDLNELLNPINVTGAAT